MFGDFFLKGDPTFSYNMADENIFHITLSAYLNTDNSLLASDSININVSNNPAAAAAAVPEPASMPILGLSAVGLLIRRRRSA